MLLEPKTLDGFIDQIKQIPKDKRKTIVIAGRHINEGTRNIAVRYHSRWEKNGALTVLIPEHWTPHGVWSRIKKQRLLESSSPMNPKERGERLAQIAMGAHSDDMLTSCLRQDGIHAPVIHLHSTLYDPKEPAGFSHLQIQEGFSEEKLKSGILCLETNEPRMASYSGSKVRKDVIIIPTDPRDVDYRDENSIVVEFYAHGRPGRKGLKVSDQEQAMLKKIWPYSSFQFPGHVLPVYLTDPIADKRTLKTFHDHFADEFDKLISHVSGKKRH